MRGLRWLLAGLAVLLVVLVAGVWLLPSMLDWNRYRATIADPKDAVVMLCSLASGLSVGVGLLAYMPPGIVALA